MNMKPEPKLSDRELDSMIAVMQRGRGDVPSQLIVWPNERAAAQKVRHFYEAARVKDAELIQKLVDALALLREVYQSATGTPSPVGDFVLAAADESGFKPSEE